MSWALSILPFFFYGFLIALFTVVSHIKCIVTTSANACEMKVRFLRRGRARYAVLRPGSKSFIIPFMQERVVDVITHKPVQLPIAFGESKVSTGLMQVDARDGTSLCVQVRFRFRISHIDGYMKDVHTPGSMPEDFATERARSVVSNIVKELRVRTHEAYGLDRVVALAAAAAAFRRTLEQICNAAADDTLATRDNPIALEFDSISTFAQIIDAIDTREKKTGSASASASATSTSKRTSASGLV